MWSERQFVDDQSLAGEEELDGEDTGRSDVFGNIRRLLLPDRSELGTTFDKLASLVDGTKLQGHEPLDIGAECVDRRREVGDHRELPGAGRRAEVGVRRGEESPRRQYHTGVGQGFGARNADRKAYKCHDERGA